MHPGLLYAVFALSPALVDDVTEITVTHSVAGKCQLSVTLKSQGTLLFDGERRLSGVARAGKFQAKFPRAIFREASGSFQDSLWRGDLDPLALGSVQVRYDADRFDFTTFTVKRKGSSEFFAYFSSRVPYGALSVRSLAERAVKEATDWKLVQSL